jgi:ADP-ribose pyrophosphatase
MTSEYTNLFHATKLTRQHDGGGVAGEDIKVYLVPKENLRSWLKQKESEGYAIDFKIHAALWAAGI